MNKNTMIYTWFIGWMFTFGIFLSYSGEDHSVFEEFLLLVVTSFVWPMFLGCFVGTIS